MWEGWNMKFEEIICTYCGTKKLKNIKDINRSIKQGKRQFCSCGCAAKQHGIDRIGRPSLPLSLEVGTLAGQLLIVENLGKRKFVTKCLTCYNTKVVSHNDLARAKRYNYSCGCKNRKPCETAALKDIFRRIKGSAKHRKIDFSLTVENVKNLCSQDCFYCKAPPIMVANNENKTAIPMLRNSIDRHDNSLGYTLENSKPCCSWCNWAKSTHSAEDFLKYLRGVVERNQNWLLEPNPIKIEDQLDKPL